MHFVKLSEFQLTIATFSAQHANFINIPMHSTLLLILFGVRALAAAFNGSSVPGE